MANEPKPLTDADIAAQDPNIANPPQTQTDSTPIGARVPSVSVTIHDPRLAHGKIDLTAGNRTRAVSRTVIAGI